MAKIRLSRIKSSAFKISSYAGPSDIHLKLAPVSQYSLETFMAAIFVVIYI